MTVVVVEALNLLPSTSRASRSRPHVWALLRVIGFLFLMRAVR